MSVKCYGDHMAAVLAKDTEKCMAVVRKEQES